MRHTKTYSSLKHWRDSVGLNQRDAARVLGLSQGRYQKIEVGHGCPRPLRAIAISKKTGVPFEKLMRVA